MKLEKAAAQLEALGNPTRLGVYRLLVRAGVAGLPVGAVQGRMEMAASTLSHHLRKLIDAELVTQERKATTLVCRAHYPSMLALVAFLGQECCAGGGAKPGSQRTSQGDRMRSAVRRAYKEA